MAGILLSDLVTTGKLPRRVAKALIADGKKTLRDLSRMTLGDLRLVPMLGPIGRQAVQNALAEHDFGVGHLEEPPPR
jgi:hypothetical protein